MKQPNRENLLKYSQNKISKEMCLDIIPVAKPRMTQADKWKKRVIVLQYWAYRDEIFYGALAQGYRPSFELIMEFIIPMPKSWPEIKKVKMDGVAHQQTPDIDNLEKGILDSLFVDDKKVHKVMASKIWGRSGKVTIKNWYRPYVSLQVDRTS